MHPDNQDPLTHTAGASYDEAKEAADSSDSEFESLGPSSMHARSYAFYPDKKRLSSSQTIGKVVLDNELIVI